MKARGLRARAARPASSHGRQQRQQHEESLHRVLTHATRGDRDHIEVLCDIIYVGPNLVTGPNLQTGCPSLQTGRVRERG